MHVYVHVCMYMRDDHGQAVVTLLIMHVYAHVCVCMHDMYVHSACMCMYIVVCVCVLGRGVHRGRGYGGTHHYYP